MNESEVAAPDTQQTLSGLRDVAQALRAVLYRFNVYVAQPEVKPGCVLRRSNVNVLESRQLVDNDQVKSLYVELRLSHHGCSC